MVALVVVNLVMVLRDRVLMVVPEIKHSGGIFDENGNTDGSKEGGDIFKFFY